MIAKQTAFIILILIPAMSLSSPCKSFADTIYLKSGRDVEGIIQSEEMGRIKLKVGDGTITLNKSEVDHIYRSTPAETAAIAAGWEESKNRALIKEKQIKERERKKKREEELKPKTANVSGENGRILVDVLLNKKIHATMVLDTGCTSMLLTNELAKRLGLSLKNATRVKAHVADGREVTALRVHLDNVKVNQSEAKYVEADVLLPGTLPVGFEDGLLGMSFLKYFSFKVDYQHNKLTLEKLR